MTPWPVERISDVGEVFDGPHATPKTLDEGPLFLGISSLNNGRLDLSQTRHVSETDFKTWTRRVAPKAGDIVFSYETKIGEAAIIPAGMRCCLGRRMGLVRLDRTKMDPRFFLFLYLAPQYQDFLRSQTVHGATVDRLLLKHFPSFPFPVPPLPEQQAIAAVLGALDDKIELNRRMNRTLEAMGRALFRSWFVDFDPVRARAEGLAPAHMNPATAALFPARFGENGLPEGWGTKKVEDALELVYGKSLTKDARQDGRFPVYGSGGITGCHSEPLVAEPTVVVGRKGTVGSLYWVPGGCFPIDTTYFVRARVPLIYAYRLLETLGLDEMNTDAAVPGLNRNNVYRLQFPDPGGALMGRFDAEAGLWQKAIDRNVEESRTLAALRDALLPKLMSGELRLRDAGRALAEAV